MEGFIDYEKGDVVVFQFPFEIGTYGGPWGG